MDLAQAGDSIMKINGEEIENQTFYYINYDGRILPCQIIGFILMTENGKERDIEGDKQLFTNKNDAVENVVQLYNEHIKELEKMRDKLLEECDG